MPSKRSTSRSKSRGRSRSKETDDEVSARVQEGRERLTRGGGASKDEILGRDGGSNRSRSKSRSRRGGSSNKRGKSSSGGEHPMTDSEAKHIAQRKLKEGYAPSTAAGAFVHEEMEHVKQGVHGAKSREQAIAIGLSKARRAGIPVGQNN
jgi:hypothetical protein